MTLTVPPPTAWVQNATAGCPNSTACRNHQFRRCFHHHLVTVRHRTRKGVERSPSERFIFIDSERVGPGAPWGTCSALRAPRAPRLPRRSCGWRPVRRVSGFRKIGDTRNVGCVAGLRRIHHGGAWTRGRSGRGVRNEDAPRNCSGSQYRGHTRGELVSTCHRVLSFPSQSGQHHIGSKTLSRR